MSLFSKDDYLNDTKRETGKKNNRIIQKKTKLPTNLKTKFSVCPRCSKVKYVRKKEYCFNCKFRFTPEKELEWRKPRFKKPRFKT